MPFSLRTFSVTLLVLALGAGGGFAQSCSGLASELNKRYVTIASQQTGESKIPEESGILVHTIHGPATQSRAAPGKSQYLDLAKLNALAVNAKKTCGDYLKQGDYLPWCGSNTKPNNTKVLSDASSWSYLRTDTRNNHTTKPGVNDEVVCAEKNDKRYGLIFSNKFANANDGLNLGCLYPLDGDTGNRKNRGCGPTTHDWPSRPAGEGTCSKSDTAPAYMKDYVSILNAAGSTAGSLVCSLAAKQFNIWVDVRKRVDLSLTTWPANEFVLHNWDGYSTEKLAEGGFLEGIYYLTGCERTSVPGLKSNAQDIAKLYKKWSGVDVPVVQLSNKAIREGSKTPFSCP